MISEAGRDFCLNDIIHPQGTFDSCSGIDKTDFVAIFECCDRFAEGNLSIAFDCKLEMTAGECTTEEECRENYRDGLKTVEQFQAD